MLYKEKWMYGYRDQSMICNCSLEEMVFNKPQTNLWFAIFLVFLAKQGIDTNRPGLFETKWVAGGKTNPPRIWLFRPIDVSPGWFYGLQLSLNCLLCKPERGLEANLCFASRRSALRAMHTADGCKTNLCFAKSR